MGNGGIFRIAGGVVLGLASWSAFQHWQQQRALNAWLAQWSQVARMEDARRLAPNERCEFGFVVTVSKGPRGELKREFALGLDKKARECR
jgi:hypothetical protein